MLPPVLRSWGTRSPWGGRVGGCSTCRWGHQVRPRARPAHTRPRGDRALALGGQGARVVCPGEFARRRIFVNFLNVSLAWVSERALQNAMPSMLGPLRPLDSGRVHAVGSRPGCCWRCDGLVTRRRDPCEAGRGQTPVCSADRGLPCSLRSAGALLGARAWAGMWTGTGSSLRLGPRAGPSAPPGW